MYQIGQVSKQLKISADTLRYYEKIGLLNSIARNTAGLRIYSEQDISKIKFIRRAQRMAFSLSEISKLLDFRKAPQQAKPEIRLIAGDKLKQIENHLSELQVLRNELKLLVGLCRDDEEGCPILNGLEDIAVVEK